MPAVAQLPPASTSLPEGGQVVAGDATLEQNGTTLSIHQSSERAAIDWRSFDVGSDARVDFLQPSAGSVTLNRVLGNNASQIFGRITATGQVFLSNPNGVYFAPGASVDVAGLVATTHAIGLEDFMAGRVKFERQGAAGNIVNEGELRAALGGYVALLAPEVRNQGVILANLGTVALAAGETFELQFGSNNTLANLRVTPATIAALVENRSAVLAPGGLIILSAQAVDRVQGGVIRNSGTLVANGLAERGGRILLQASDRIENTGVVDASASAEGPAGEIRLEAPGILNTGTLRAAGGFAQVAGDAGPVSGGGHASGGGIFIAAGDLLQAPEGLLDVSAAELGGKLSIEAGGAVELAGRIEAHATAEQDSRGGDVIVRAASLSLDSMRVDVSGVTGGRVLLEAQASAGDAPSAPQPSPAPERLALLGSTQLSARGRRGQGGSLTLLGDDIALDGSTLLDAAGSTGGGTVRVGGGWQGGEGLREARTVAMGEDVRIDASALERGDGGSVVLWSDVGNADSHTTVGGSIVARGGASGGDGGHVETSGHTLQVRDGFRVDTLATAGRNGEWLLDPIDFSINAGTGSLTTSSIGASTLGGILDSSSVTIATDASTGGTGHIMVNSAITKTGAAETTLTLRAHARIIGSQNIGSTSGKLSVVLWSGYGGGSYGVQFGNITTQGGHFFVGGGSGSTTWNGLTVPNGPARASTNFNSIDGGGNITTAGGSVYLWGSDGVSGGAGLSYADLSRSINAGTGNITLRANTFYWPGSSLNITTTGEFTLWSASGTIASDTGSFAYGTDLGWIKFNANPGKFTWGGENNTQDVLFSTTNNATLTVAGPISLYGGNLTLNGNLSASGDILARATGDKSITLNADITKAGASASTLTLLAGRNIQLNNGVDITSSAGPLNVVMVADWDSASAGAIYVNGASGNRVTFDTRGGHVWIGGNGYNGSLPDSAFAPTSWNGLQVGGGYATTNNTGINEGVNLRYTSLATGGGNLYIAGASDRQQASEDRYAVLIKENTQISTGSGNIDIAGWLAPRTAAGPYARIFGVAVQGSTLQTTTGNLTVTGGEDANAISYNYGGAGVWLYNSTLESTGAAGRIRLTGTTGADNSDSGSDAGRIRAGVWLQADGNNALSRVATAGGDVEIVGTSNQTNTPNSAGVLLSTRKPVDDNANNPVVQVVAGSGNVSITGDNPANSNTGSSGIRLDGLNYGRLYIGQAPSGSHSGDTTLTGRSVVVANMASSYLQMGGSGALAIQPIGDGFVQGTATGQTLGINSSWNLGSAHSSLRLGKDVAVVGAGSQITVDTALTAAGPIRLYGDSVQINADLTTTAGGGEIVAKARSNVVMGAGRALQTNGGDITLWADSNAASGGFILLTDNNRLDSRSAAARTANAEASNETSATGGGRITLAGGNGATAAEGYAESAGTSERGGVNLGDQTYNSGAHTNVTTIYSGGGDVLIRGRQTGSAMMGVNWVNGGLLNAGQGTVRIEGVNTGTGSHGVEIGSWRSSGSVMVFAGGGNAGTPAIAVTGTGSGAAGTRGLLLQMARFYGTGAGGIALTGNGGAGGAWGIGTGTSTVFDVQAVSGAIALDGGSRGISMAGSLGALNGSPITASSSNITLTGDRVEFNGATAVRTSGTLTVQPSGSSFANALSWPLSNLVELTPTVSGLTLGKDGNNADITLGSAVSIAGPIRIYGGNVALNGNLTTTQAGAGLLVKARGSIASNNGRLFQTNNGDISFWSNASNAGTGGQQTFGDSNIFNSVNGATTQTSGGGRILFGGGLDDGSNGGVASDGRPDGFAASGSTSGISFGSNTNSILTSLYSGGGDITLRGSSTNTRGIVFYRASNVQAGNGRLVMDGRSTQNHGVELGSFLNTGETNTFAAAGGSASQPTIEIYGATTASANAAGVQSSDATLLATGAGGISITGKSAGGYTNGALNLNADVLAASGPITLTADGSDGLRLRGALGAKSGSPITASSSNITLNFDKLTVNTGIALDTSGTATLQPNGTSFSSAFGWPIANLTLASTVSGLTIGKSGNTADITLASATSIAGPVSIHGGNIAIDAALAATGGNTITLQATGNVTDGASGSVSAASLLLLGGAVTLDGNSNAIGTLAASGVGSLSYVDSDALTLGTVGVTNGIAATGVVNIATLTGDLTVARNLATTNATASALTLNAGRSAAAGTAAGGNLVLSGSPSISVGNGGRAVLYTGSVGGSTGLTSLVGSGSGRFRYGSDEISQNYTLALGSGLNAIYREQPAVSRRVLDGSMTYGDALPGWTFELGGAVNGDTWGQAFAAAPTITVGGSTSTTGHVTAGTHALTGSGGSSVSQLGYAVGGGITGGTLTVLPRTLTASYTAADKVYDGSLAASVTGSDDRMTGDLLSLSHGSAAFADPNAGTGKSITVGGLALSGADAGNYALASTSATTTASITPRTLTLSAVKEYDGSTALGAGAVSFGNLVGSETLGYSGATASDAHVATAGKRVGTLTLVDGSNGGLAANYQLPVLDAAHAPMVITPRALTGAAAIGGTLTKVYDGGTAATGASLGGSITGAVAGDSVVLDTSGVVLAYDSAHVATATSIGATGSVGFVIAASANGSQASDYGFTAPLVAPVAASITPAALTATLANAGVTKVYDGSTAAPAGFTPVWNLAGLVAGDTAASLAHTAAVYDSKDVASASQLTLNGLALTGITGSHGSLASDYALATTSASVAAGITPRTVTVSAGNGISKVYDGTTAMTGLRLDLAGAAAGDQVTVSGDGAFQSRHAGTGIGYTLSGLTLGGADAGNYHLVSGGSISGSNGTITPRALVVGFAGVDKVYDGGVAATVTTTDDRIAGDMFDLLYGAAFADKNVGIDKTVSVTGLSLAGVDAANYTVAAIGTARADITRLASVSWTGGVSGNWFDPANWAGGAVPDLSNVANVVIPANVVVSFDPAAITAPAQAGPVHLDGLGSAGGLVQAGGELNVGSGGITLASLVQNGGSFTGAGDVVLGGFAQTGGTTSIGGDLAVDRDFSQGASGSVTVRGDANLRDTQGGATLGNLRVEGSLDLVSSGGDITQSAGTALVVQGSTTAAADSHDILLDQAGNDFGGVFGATGRRIVVTDGTGGLVLGDVAAGSDFAARSMDGDIAQDVGARLQVGGAAELRAPGASVALAPAGNSFGAGLVVEDAVGSRLQIPPPPATPGMALPTPQNAPPALGDAAQAGVSVRLVQPATSQGTSLVRVDVPEALAATGFTFPLPAQVRQAVPPKTPLAVQLEDGSPLPSWLRFDRRRLRFVVAGVPDGRLPLRLAIAWNGERVIVEVRATMIRGAGL
ncbi:MAG: filamentous hemagglutinin N-terminal domain-containing protein [Acidobacteria bacterium]|nr:filamentous hemagglutinin N-terminal domain-containing protein [Acidobacteriota bacterium]